MTLYRSTTCVGFATLCCGLALALGVHSASAQTVDEEIPAGLASRLDALAEGIEHAEAVRAVKRLQHAYGHYSEFGLWHDFADLFGDDAVGHYPHGDFGREGIRRLFLEEVGQGMLGLADGRLYPHIVLSPVVSVSADGASAHARWRILAMLGGYGGNASWTYGIYENVYVKEDGVWKVHEVTFDNRVSGRYGQSLQPAPDEPAVGFHYEPSQVGAARAERAGADSRAGPQTGLAGLADRLAAFEPRLTRMHDENQVINLHNAYGYYVDRKLWDDVADLFADDGTMELGQRGVYVGKASIRRALDQFGPAGLGNGEIDDGLQLQPVVTVAPDGLTAKARSVELGMSGEQGVAAQWNEGVYENTYVKEDGVWKIQALHYYRRLVTDYDEGWALNAVPAPGPSAEFPPDRPPTRTYESYPSFFIPPLSFVHPVTGRKPQYPEGYDAPPDDARGSAAPAADPPRTVAQLQRRLTEAERALRIVAAYDQAENLLNAYSYYLDAEMWDAAAALFAAEGWSEVPTLGVYESPERIRTALGALERDDGALPRLLAFRLVTQPVIHPSSDGRSARIRARLFQIDAREEADDLYVAGIYEASVALEGADWKLASLDLDHTWAASHAEGWARVDAERIAEYFTPPETALRVRPDGPLRGPEHPPFPRITDLAFHYANPVSGRRPPRAIAD